MLLSAAQLAALGCLNTLIDQGYEFSEALDKTLEALAVNRDDLVAAYDSQPI